MSEQGLPVTVAVKRPDGSVEHVRVGTAFRQGEGFLLQMAELTIGGAAPAAGRRPAAAGQRPVEGEGAPAGMVFPPYGRSKGQPVRGASLQDLEFYANGSRRSLADQSKSRWHDKERTMLAAIEAEIARQRGGEALDAEEPPPPGDEDAPF